MNVHVAGKSEPEQEQGDRHVAKVQHLADGFAVDACYSVNSLVNTMRALGVSAGKPSDVSPIPR